MFIKLGIPKLTEKIIYIGSCKIGLVQSYIEWDGNVATIRYSAIFSSKITLDFLSEKKAEDYLIKEVVKNKPILAMIPKGIVNLPYKLVQEIIMTNEMIKRELEVFTGTITIYGEVQQEQDFLRSLGVCVSEKSYNQIHFTNHVDSQYDWYIILTLPTLEKLDPYWGRFHWNLEDIPEKIIAGTGHRPQTMLPKLENGKPDYSQANRYFQNLVLVIEKTLLELKPTKVISGMALHFDQALAQAAINLGIPVIAAIPCLNQDKKWLRKVQEYYNELLSKCSQIVQVTNREYTPSCMQERNIWMIDNSDEILSCYNKQGYGGTFNCLQYANTLGRKNTNIWDDVVSIWR